MLPFFDADTNMLYLAGKGDTNIRYFEIDDEPPYQYFVNQFIGKEPRVCVRAQEGAGHWQLRNHALPPPHTECRRARHFFGTT